MILFKHQMERISLILHFLLISNNIFTGMSESPKAVINIRWNTTSTLRIPVNIKKDKYKLFVNTFLNNTTSSVSLGYSLHSPRYIDEVHKIEGDHSNKCFTCLNNQNRSIIQCRRNNTCTVYCPSGFAICWHYNDEYIFSTHLHNSTICTLKKYIATCYTLVNNNHSATEYIYTSPTSSIKVNTGLIFNSSTTTSRYTSQVSNYSPTYIQTYTTQQENSFITTTSLSNDQKPNSSSSVLASVIAGVTVSIVIVIILVVLIVVLCKRRKLKQQLTSNTGTSTVRIELNANTNISKIIYNQHVPGYNEHTISKSSISMITNNEHSKNKINPHSNSYANMSDNRNTVYDIPHLISDSSYVGIDEGKISTLPDILLSTDKDNNCYSHTLDDNPQKCVSRREAGDIGNDNCSYEGDSLNANKLHPVSTQAEYAILNKNTSYNNFSEILENSNSAAEHDYNNITNDNTTIETTEPAKHVYSKLGENIRLFDNTYGDLGVPMQAGEDNQTLANDNTYFILEAEDNLN